MEIDPSALELYQGLSKINRGEREYYAELFKLNIYIPL
jgi:hypothetical protein